MNSSLPIYQYGTQVLRKKAEPVQPEEPQLEKLISEMWESMYMADGVGLAAPQVGKSLRFFVMDASVYADEDPSQEGIKRVIINPEILEVSEQMVSIQEGCLSIPGIHEDVLRPDWVKARYQNEHFETVEETFRGFSARIFQHENDHLDGKLFTDHLSSLKKRLINGKLKDVQTGKAKTAYKIRLPK